MNRIQAALFAFLVPCAATAEELLLSTRRLIESSSFNVFEAERQISDRIRAGVYDGYHAELCVDDTSRCASEVFKPFRVTGQDSDKYDLEITHKTWDALPSEVRNEAIGEIIYYTWGHRGRRGSPLDVEVRGAIVASPLMFLSPDSAMRYLQFATPGSLNGGVGGDAYGPNCWFNSISMIADSQSSFGRLQMLVPASWEQARFMGPTEFREHLKSFTEVKEPRFGDIVRYYTDDPVYSGLIFGGEVHAAVYIGKEVYNDNRGQNAEREVALTKNGRSDLDFLVFQEIKAMDDLYLGINSSGHTIKKGYFRVKRGAALLDPAKNHVLSGAYHGYLVDQKNYAER